jgi:hypothetical protein
MTPSGDDKIPIHSVLAGFGPAKAAGLSSVACSPAHGSIAR